MTIQTYNNDYQCETEQAYDSEHTYSTEEFINSILRITFQQKQYVDRKKLHQIAYRTAQEIYSQTGRKVINEKFIVNVNNPSLQSVNVYYLQNHNGESIEKYMLNKYERTVFINDPEIEKIILQQWNTLKCMPLHLLMTSTSQQNFGELAIAS